MYIKPYKTLPYRAYRKLISERPKRFLKKARQVLLASPDVSASDRKRLQQVSLNLHHRDQMYKPNLKGAQHYLSVGLSAMGCISEASENANTTVGSVLDLPCGYGRVLRFLKVEFPEAHITGCELNPVALSFCKKRFGVDTVLSAIDFNQILLNQVYDLIWCGSLFTHIPMSSAKKLLQFLSDNLSEQGICVFTTHGEHSVDLITSKRYTYSLSATGQDTLLSTYDSIGYGFADFKNEDAYGISAVKQDIIVALAASVGLKECVLYKARGWDNHQDVYAFKKVNY